MQMPICGENPGAVNYEFRAFSTFARPCWRGKNENARGIKKEKRKERKGRIWKFDCESVAHEWSYAVNGS